MRSLIIIALLLGYLSLKSQANFKLPMMVCITDEDTTYCLESTKVVHQQRYDTLVFIFEDEVLVFHPCEKKRVRRGAHESELERANRKEIARYNKTTRAIEEHIKGLNYKNRNTSVTQRYSIVQGHFNKDRYIIYLVASIKRASFIFFITNYDRPGSRSFILGYNATVCGR